MATARRQGTNVNVSTYDDTGSPDYTSITTWEADTDTDLVTADVSERLETQQSKIYSITKKSFTGAITDTDHRRSIGPAPGVIHNGTPGSGSGFSTTDDRVFTPNEGFFQIHDLILQISKNSAGIIRAVVLSGDESAAVGCIVDTPSNGGSGTADGIWGDSGAGNVSYAVDCLVVDANNDGFFSNSGTFYVYNCTAINSGGDNYQGSGTVAKNCIAQDGGNNDYLNVTTTTCISKDATGDIQATLTFSDKANDDYHLVASDTAAIDAGTDLSSDTNYAFDDDVDGDLWGSSWDIGFDSSSTISGSLLSVLGIG